MAIQSSDPLIIVFGPLIIKYLGYQDNRSATQIVGSRNAFVAMVRLVPTRVALPPGLAKYSYRWV